MGLGGHGDEVDSRYDNPWQKWQSGRKAHPVLLDLPSSLIRIVVGSICIAIVPHFLFALIAYNQVRKLHICFVLRSTFATFVLKREDTCARCEKYSRKLDISHSLVRIFANTLMTGANLMSKSINILDKDYLQWVQELSIRYRQSR